MTFTIEEPSRDVWIVYDGECPMCRSFVMLYRLRALGAAVHLVNARAHHPILASIDTDHFDLDEGMVVRFDGRTFYAADAMHILAVLGSDGTLFNRLNRAVFRRPRLARILYPALVFGRKLLLRILHRRLIAEAAPPP